MSNPSNLVEETSRGIQSIFHRLSEFFHIFDLSFFVAGVSTFGAFSFLYYRLGFTGGYPFPDWTSIFAFLIAAYLCGLLSFSIGRFINGMLFRRNVLSDYLWPAIEGQNLEGEIIDQFNKLDQPHAFPIWRLYIRLWQELIDRHPNSLAVQHLSRYWAMAATFDSVATSLIIWAIICLPIDFFGQAFLTNGQSIFVIILLLLASLACLRQGGKYYEYQVEDIVAALASMNKTLD